MSGFDGKNFIGGEWRPAASGRTFEQRNPAFLHEVTGTFADSSAADVDAAIAAAQAAFPAWRALSPLARKSYLDRALRAMIARRDEIAAVITRENGKALREARGEVDSAIKEMDYQIGEGVRLCGQTVPVEIDGTLAYSTREALGPVAIVTPWNFPFNVPCRKGTPALMGGNTVVLKPASLTPTQLELGGKNPAIVLPDADLDLAVAEIVKGAFACSGQWCTSTSRVIVLEETAAELTERLVAAAKALAVRDGSAEDCGMGPVCGAKQKTDILGYIAKGKAEGARLLTGGSALDGEDYDHGCFVAPTVFDRVKPTMTIAREEIFGPVLAIMTVASFEEAVDVANGVAYGLSSSIFTNDLKRALTYMERAEVGLAHVNLMTALKEPQLSFGGVKESGAGLPEAGSSGIEFFTHHKVCYVKYR